ncbi:MAG: hypothetical protein IKI95_02970 [Clostridia bacterium]|nr:hypothetical protein [Clostridia bacterium]
MNANEDSVSTGANVPLSTAINLTDGSVTSAEGSTEITLVEAGNYLISYFTTVTRSADGVVSVALTANDVILTQTESAQTVVATDETSLSNQTIYTAQPNTIISLQNTSGEEVVFSNLNLIVQFLG